MISGSTPVWDAIDRGQPGDTVSLTVRRPGGAEARTVQLSLDPVSIPTTISGSAVTPIRLAALEILSFYPLPFLVVAVFVLLQRPLDRHAWLLVVMFTSFIAGQRPLELEPVIHPVLRKPMIAYCLLWAIVPPGALYAFFSTFPEPTPLDKRLPWLKVALLGFPLLAGAWFAVVTMLSSETPSYLRPQGLGEAYEARLGFAIGMYSLAGYGLGFASLAWNAFRARPEIRRRTQVMLWGTVGALLPLLAVGTYAASRGLSIIDVPFWLWVGPLLALFLLPVSFAYAVVKHHVMEIPVLLRRSARYVMVRHAIVTTGIVIGAALTFLFAAVFSRVLPDYSGRTSAFRSGMPAGIDESGHRSTQSEQQALSAVAGAVFGVIVVVATRKGVRKVTERLDRAFFREAYDARRILQDLARETRTATHPHELASLLERSLADAMHPSTVTVLLRTPSGRLEPAATRAGLDLPGIDAAAIESESAMRPGVVLIRPGDIASSLQPLAVLAPDLIALMRGHDDRIEGLLVLGPRLSDEPYGMEDRELVALVAGQAATALENLRLAGAIAERLEAERSAVREIEIAREVQAKLLPQRAPAMASLDYAGTCIQARLVGGDYYDFLYLGPGRLGLVLADISGKGISAALLMANLQASLRSQYAQTPDDLPRVLRAVNQSFFDSSATSRYTTLFFGVYDEASSCLRYVNCGHLPPVPLGPDGSIDHLPPTAPVIGLFEEWSCDTRELHLKCNDTLLMFTDGVVEALDAAEQEFGEERLVTLLRQNSSVPSATVVERIAREVQGYSGSALWDDLTLVVARARTSSPSATN